ncbi:hypothetical protein P886_1456 [Alteromonadaceae bacterium 2753L.S.0a.02]|nr:hypothetical protein P886_1456 [Alteromonadaceae bacterium 2753L.S.0a.02]
MTQPRYSINLTGTEINNSVVSCTGEQLALIVKNIISYKELRWYASDVSINSSERFWADFSIAKPSFVGDSSTLICEINQVEQFFSGVFLAVFLKNEKDIILESIETEDEKYRDIGEFDIEIRAFDTTYFEIYSIEPNLLAPICEKFGVPVRTYPE